MTATVERPAEIEKEIGKDRRRKEDQRLITGRTRWTDNIVLPGMLHVAMVRSPFAHATITNIDKSAAEAAPNVVTVITGADVAEEQGGLPNAWPITPDQVTPVHPPIAVDRVVFAGEIVAVVVARTAAEARDAAELVDVDYDELPAALDLKAAAEATREGGALAHPDLGTNKSAFWKFDSAEAGTGGNVDEAIEKARGDGIVIEREYRQQRLIPAFMEPRSTVVDPTGEQITMWSATQIPHILRFLLAAVTGVSEAKIRVIAPDVGGGFGGKLQTTPEEFITFLLARRLGKPVKYTETRSESLMAAHHGRDQWQKLTLSAEKDGTVTGLKVELLADLGSHVSLVGGGVPVLGAFMFNAIYKFPAYQFNCQTVLTNKTWTDAYRGAGRPEATFGIERIMDELAAELGVDPFEVREKNWITAEEFPFTTVAGLEYDSGNYEAATAKAKELFGYDELRAEQKERRASGDPVQLGIGVSTFTEMCGLAPSRVLGSLDYGAGGWEHASVRMLPTGKVEVLTGASAHGQGHETAFSQIVADRLGVAFEDVEVLHGDTEIAHKGLDTYGSRSLVVGGEAIVKAADKVIEKAKPIAAHLLEASVDDIEFSGGRFTVRGTDQGLAMAEIALATFAAHNLPDGVEPSLDSDATFDPVNFNYPHGTHLCAMEVDTETGQVTMRKYAACDDIGNIINPLIVEGQLHGGLVQGIAQALWEEAVYDDAGTLVTGSFVDYLLPTVGRHDQLRPGHTTSPATTNTLGTKGVGEAGTIASTPAVVNAVVDAIRHLGVTTSGCRARPSGCGRPSTTPGAVAPPRPRGPRRRTSTSRPAWKAPPTARPEERTHDPRTVRLPGAHHGRGGPGRAGRARRRRQDPGRGAEPAPRAADAAQRPRGRHRPQPHRLPARDPRRRRRHRHRRHDPARGRGARPPGRRARRPDQQGRRAPRRPPDPPPRDLRRGPGPRRPRRRPGGPGPRAGRAVRHRGAGRHPHRGGRRLLRRPLRDRDRRGRDPHRDPDAQAHRLGGALREVRARRPPVADRGDRRDRQGRGRPHRRGPGGDDQHGLHPAAGALGRGGPRRASPRPTRPCGRRRPWPPTAPTRPPT